MSNPENISFYSEENSSLIDFNKSISFEQSNNNSNNDSYSTLPSPLELPTSQKIYSINNKIPEISIKNYSSKVLLSPFNYANNYLNQNLINNTHDIFNFNFNLNELPKNFFISNNNNNNSISLFNSKIEQNTLKNNIFNQTNNNKNFIPKEINSNDSTKIIDKKKKSKNIIDINLLLSGKENRTCIRLMPIPNKLSPFDMIRIIDKILKTVPGKRIYKSIYVPLTKIIGKNIGYCFIDLVSPKYVVEFYNIFNGITLKKCKKPCSVLFADRQNNELIEENPLHKPIFFMDFIKNDS